MSGFSGTLRRAFRASFLSLAILACSPEALSKSIPQFQTISLGFLTFLAAFFFLSSSEESSLLDEAADDDDELESDDESRTACKIIEYFIQQMDKRNH